VYISRDAQSGSVAICLASCRIKSREVTVKFSTKSGLRQSFTAGDSLTSEHQSFTFTTVYSNLTILHSSITAVFNLILWSRVFT
jgi:hypothetical protein